MKLLITLSVLLHSTFALAYPSCTVRNLEQFFNPNSQNDVIKKIHKMDQEVTDFYQDKMVNIYLEELQKQKNFYRTNTSPQLAERIITSLDKGMDEQIEYDKKRFEERVNKSMKAKAKALKELLAIQKKYNVQPSDCISGSTNEYGLNLLLKQIDAEACGDIIFNMRDQQSVASKIFLETFEDEATVSHHVGSGVKLNGLLFNYKGAVDKPTKISEFSLNQMEGITKPSVFSSHLQKEDLKALDKAIENGPYTVNVKLVKFSDEGVVVDHKKKIITYKVKSYKNGTHICSPRANLMELIVEKKNPKEIGIHCGLRGKI